MQIASVSQPNGSTQSILKAANQQPRLAADLISKTVESLLQAQSLQTSVQSVGQSNATLPGTTISITA